MDTQKLDKLLVLGALTKTNTKAIKDLTGSALVDELKFSNPNYYALENRLYRVIRKALSLTRTNFELVHDVKIFLVDSNASSENYALKDPEFLAAIEVNNTLIKRLDLLIDLEYEISEIRYLAEKMIFTHTNLNVSYLKSFGNNICMNQEYENFFKKISQEYADKERILIIKEIKEIIRDTW